MSRRTGSRGGWRRSIATALLTVALLMLGAAAAGVSPASVLDTISSTTSPSPTTSTDGSSSTSTNATTSTDAASSTSTNATTSTDAGSSTSSTNATSTNATTSTDATTTNGNGKDKSTSTDTTTTAAPSVVTSAAGTQTTVTENPTVSTYDQCSNDLGSGYASGDTGCRWINGNLQSNNSLYAEGDATVQRLWLTGLAPGQTHSVTFTYGTTKGGKHAYDFLTTWNWSESWIDLADRCQDITGCETASESTAPIPVDSNAGGFDSAAGTRNFVMRGGTLTAVSSPAIVSGSYAGDSETAIKVTFTVGPGSGAMCATKQGVTTCGVALWFGAHVARQADWGTGTGAASISGSPYHVALSSVDTTAIGQRDNQMQSNTIPQTGTLTITKSFDPGTSGFTGKFSIPYDCDDGTAHDGTAVLGAGETATITGIPLGTHCTVSEPNLPTAPTGWTFGAPSISPSQPVTISTSTPVAVTVTNSITRDQGYLKISKVFDAKTSGFSGTFAIVYNCGAGDQTLNLHGNDSQTVGPFNTGTSCTVSEPNLPTAPTGWTFGTPVITGSPATIVKGAAADAVAVTVTNSITRDQGSLQILKTLNNPDGASVPASFAVAYDCGGSYTGTKTVAPSSPALVDGIPTGSTCTVTEVAPDSIAGYTWGPITYTPQSVVIATKGETFSITVGNSITRDRGSLQIQKTVDNPDGAFLPATFSVDYDCGSGYTGTTVVAPLSPATIPGIPTGNTCSVTEVAPAPIPGYTWGTVTYTPASVVISTKDQTFTIAVGNSITRDRGSLQILKTVNNPDAASLPASFKVNYDCGPGYTGQVSVAPDSPATVNGIPTGNSCSVNEVAPDPIAGYTWADPAAYTPDSVVIDSKGGTFSITVGNAITRDRGSLRILKTVTNPDDATLPASYTVNYDCGGDFKGQKTIAPGSPATVSGLPSDSTCRVTEVAPSPIAGYTWGAPTYTPASVVIAKGQTVDITVGNSISREPVVHHYGSLRIVKTVSNSGGAALPGYYTVNYDCGSGYTGQVTVAPGTPAGVPNLPAGSTCTVKEVAPPAIPGYTWGAATYTPSSVVIAENTTVELTVGNSITREPRIDLAVTKVDSPDPVVLGNKLTYTMVVTNNGPDTATGVQLADPIPAGSSFVSVTTTTGTCTGGSLVSCQLGTMAAGSSATITVVVKPTVTGTLANTATVVGNEAETNTANNRATATTRVQAPFRPPVIKPKPVCYAIALTPKSLTVGHRASLKLKITASEKPVAGTRAKLKGPAISKLTRPTNRLGRVAVSLNPTKPGIVQIRPVKVKGCSSVRVGIVGVFTPPVTG